MKRHAVIIVKQAKHGDLEISKFFNVARLFVHKVRQEFEASHGNVESVAKRKNNINLVQTQFVQQVQGIIDEDLLKSIRAISRDIQVSE